MLPQKFSCIVSINKISISGHKGIQNTTISFSGRTTNYITPFNILRLYYKSIGFYPPEETFNVNETWLCYRENFHV